MPKKDKKSLGLKSNYTFQDLVLGSNNQIPAKACIEMAKAPGDVYNPLFIYGTTGVGKTHLMQAVAQMMLESDPEMKVKYISAERFMNEVIVAISDDKLIELRARYSDLDLWVLDDVQYLMESKSSQSEFFHIFNNLHQENCQIILSADRPPNKLAQLDKTIRTRLEWGLVAELKPPDPRTRLEILKKKQKKYQLNLEDDLLKYAAGMIRSNVIELEGFLKKINAYVTLSHQSISFDLVKTVVGEFLDDGQADQEPEPIPDEAPETIEIPTIKKAEKPQEMDQVIKEAKVQNGPNPSVPIPSASAAPPVKPPEPKESAAPTPSPPPAPAPKAPPPPTPPPEKPSSKPLEVVLPSMPEAPDKQKPVEKEPPKEELPKPPVQPVEKETEKPPEEAKPSAEEPVLGFEEEEEKLQPGHKEVGAVFFYPDGSTDALETVHKKFQEVIKKHKLKFRLKRAHSEAYECSGKVNYSSFVDVCKKHKVPVAVVIGPPPAAFIPEQDFYDLLSVTLDVQGISLQLVNWPEINKDYRYLNLALDIALVRTR